MKVFSFIIWSFFVLTTFSSCLPESGAADEIGDLDVVYTNHNSSFNFGSGTTYAIPTNVIIVTADPITPGVRPPTLDFIVADQILAAIRNNMNARGFTQVNIQANPDFIILPSATEEGREIIYNYGSQFWTWWYPEFGAGLIFQYPNFDPQAIQGVDTGSLLLQFIDNRNRTPNTPVSVHWISVVNLALSGSQTDNSNRATRGVNQSFIQSPYIQK
ncbi:DUF4136 domain-containing protein [Shivajiella indica]|uniref:DUF4136 domain-containing protein n=1 Tax=Shivajiella indica TaxID=872115 RepID=A0ABW5B754_9BACT